MVFFRVGIGIFQKVLAPTASGFTSQLAVRAPGGTKKGLIGKSTQK